MLLNSSELMASSGAKAVINITDTLVFNVNAFVHVLFKMCLQMLNDISLKFIDHLSEGTEIKIARPTPNRL